MSMSVGIEIRGLALCFLKPRATAWTVLFACDDVHDLSFTYPKNGKPTTVKLHERRAPDQTIEFDRGEGDDVFVRDRPRWDDVDEIFNLNGSYAHDRNLNEFRARDKVDEIRMSVPYSKFDGHDETSEDYFVQRLDFPGAPVFNIGDKSQMVSLKFAVQKDLVMRLRQGGADVPPSPFTFPFVDGASVLLKFDNDCEGKCKHNDFVDLYELVTDNDPAIRFAAGKIKRPPPDFSHRDLEIKRSTAYGNCDPSWSEPPPGP